MIQPVFLRNSLAPWHSWTSSGGLEWHCLKTFGSALVTVAVHETNRLRFRRVQVDTLSRAFFSHWWIEWIAKKEELWRWDLNEFSVSDPIPQQAGGFGMCQQVRWFNKWSKAPGEAKTCQSMAGAMLGLCWSSTLFWSCFACSVLSQGICGRAVPFATRNDLQSYKFKLSAFTAYAQSAGTSGFCKAIKCHPGRVLQASAYMMGTSTNHKQLPQQGVLEQDKAISAGRQYNQLIEFNMETREVSNSSDKIDPPISDAECANSTDS